MASLTTDLLGLRLRNPVLPAAGPPGRDGAALIACANGGAGGLVAKTISTRAAAPPIPNMAEITGGMVNTELWSELPPEQWLEKEYALARTAGLPLIISLGYTADEIAELAPRVAPFADAVELAHRVKTETRHAGLFELLLEVRNASAAILDNTSLADLSARNRRPIASRRRSISAQARWSCSASAVSSRSEEVMPWWSQVFSGPRSSLTCVRNAITSWWTVASIAAIRAASGCARARIASALPAGARPVSSMARTAAISTSSHVAKRAASVQTFPISGSV